MVLGFSRTRLAFEVFALDPGFRGLHLGNKVTVLSLKGFFGFEVSCFHNLACWQVVAAEKV